MTVVHGDADDVVSVSDSAKLVASGNKRYVRLVELPGEGHDLGVLVTPPAAPHGSDFEGPEAAHKLGAIIDDTMGRAREQAGSPRRFLAY